jgi:hypothetical protein
MRWLNRVTSGYQAWIEYAVLRQADGTYLVRLGPHVYRVDEATKDRYVRLTHAIALIGVVALATALLLPAAAWGDGKPPLPLLILAAGLVFMIAAHFWMLHILKTGTRISRELWTKPHPMTLWPFWLRAIWLAVGVGTGVLGNRAIQNVSACALDVRRGLALLFVLIFIQRRELFGRATDNARGL